MRLTCDFTRFRDDIQRLFQSVFADAEGQEEGELIGRLAANLIKTTPAAERAIFIASSDDGLLACAIFIQLNFGDNPRRVFLLSPMAVCTAHQSEGIGQALIRYGLDWLQHNDVDIAVTYGDPAYYRKVGLQPITEDILPAPRRLQQPEGWLAQTLQQTELTTFSQKPRCARALDDDPYW